MSVAEIKQAITHLSPAELAEVIAFIREREAAAWEAQIEADFSRGGTHYEVLNEIDAQIDSGNFKPLR